MKVNIVLFFCFLFSVFTFNLVAQNNVELVKAKTYLDKKGEVYFTFNVNSKSEINTLTHLISIDNVKGQKIFAYANKKEFNKFLSFGYEYKVLSHPGNVTEGINMHSEEKGIWQFDTYPTYQEYETMMTTFAANYPNLCKIVQIGTTVQGRKLLVAKISDNVNQSEAEPQFFYTSTMHGDEATGYILMLRLINHLLINYSTNSEVTALVNNMEIWINPNANPDGTYAGGNNTVSGATRYNGNNIDCNRNFLGISSAHPDGNAYQPEVLAMMGFADTMNFVMSANFHGGAEVMNYPFDEFTSSQKTHADDNWLQYVSREFADTVHVHSSTLMTDLNNGITNGGDWYVVYGGRQDYMTWYQQDREITIELSATKLVAASELNSFWTNYYRSLINYMKEAGYGIRGTITDACTGLPIQANVFINSHDRDSSHIFSGERHGDYYRPIIAGTYSVTFSANGYTPQTVNVTVANQSTVTKNIQLAPVTPIADFTSDVTSTCSGAVNFSCITGGVTTWTWNFGDGVNSNLQNPQHNYSQSGTYNVSLSVGNCSGTNSILNAISVNVAIPPTVTNASRCGSGSVNLSATGSGSLRWYDSATNGTMIAQGNSYSTPVLSQNTTYFVESMTNQPSEYVGKPDSAGVGSYYNISTIRSLIFDCYEPVTLVSVKMYAATAGPRTIELRNNAGSVLQTLTVNIPQWESRVTLNFNIQPGTGYQLALNTINPNMYRNGTTISLDMPYPYTINNVISITGNNANNLRYYYFFFDWEIQQAGCTSARTPVTATINQNPVVTTSVLTSISCNGMADGSAIASVSSGHPPYTYLWSDGSSVAMTMNVSAGNYCVTVWDDIGCTSLGVCQTILEPTAVSANITVVPESQTGAYDGLASANPFGGTPGYTYQWSNFSTLSTITGLSAGTYTITVTDSNLCTYVVTAVVDVLNLITENVNSKSVTVFPNPVNNSVQVSSGLSIIEIEFTNLIGDKILLVQPLSKSINIDLSTLENGVYLMKIKDISGNSSIQKIIIQK